MKSLHEKPQDECSDRDLLIRIDERTQGFPQWKSRVERSLVAMGVVILFVLLKTYPAIVSALANASF